MGNGNTPGGVGSGDGNFIGREDSFTANDDGSYTLTGHTDVDTDDIGVGGNTSNGPSVSGADDSLSTDKSNSVKAGLKAGLKGFSIGGMLAGVPGAVIGTALLAWKAYSDEEKKQISANVKAMAKANNISLTDEECNALATDLANMGEGKTIGDPAGTDDDGNGSEHNFSDIYESVFDKFDSGETLEKNESEAAMNGLATIPSSIQTGLDQFVTDSQAATDAYKAKADALWNDYLDFEKTYFDKNELTLDTYNKDIASIPGLNLKMPNSMGGATVAMAPRVHSAMYGNQANTRSNIINQQANTALAGLTNRTGLAQNQYGVDSTQASNALIPTQTALDLYKLERAGELGLQQVEAGKADSPSAWTTWAPVVGGLLSTGDDGTSAADELISLAGSFF